MRLGLAAARDTSAATACAAQCGVLVGVAVRCRRSACRCLTRQIGTRDADAVIAARIDDHVGLGRHVAGDALRAGAAGRVVMVLDVSNFAGRWHCAQRALPSARRSRRVRVVAVGAGDAGAVHAALQERAVFEHLAVDLAVGVIKAGLEQRRAGRQSRNLPARRIVVERPCAARGRGRRHRVRRRPAAGCGGRCRSSGFIVPGAGVGRRSQAVKAHVPASVGARSPAPRRHGWSRGRGRPRRRRSRRSRRWRSCWRRDRNSCADRSSGSRRIDSSRSGRARSSAAGRRRRRSFGIEGNQRWPPWSFGRVSQAMPSACSRPPGKAIRYCCSGSTPKV